MGLVLTKNIYKNLNFSHAISTIISEYDIEHAILTAYYDITKDKDKYEAFLKMPKMERNITFGDMQKEDRNLSKLLEDRYLEYLNWFISKNNLSDNNIIETTRDSILIVNRLPKITSLKLDPKIYVNFRDKDGPWTSCYRISNTKLVLYDSFTDRIRIKGVDDEKIQKSPFIRKYYLQFLKVMELYTDKLVDKKNFQRQLTKMRMKYINSPDMDIYRSIEYDNNFVFSLGNDVFESNTFIDDSSFKFNKSINFEQYVLPLIQKVV